MSELLVMAQEAARQSNWPLTAHYLQQILQQAPSAGQLPTSEWRELALQTLEMGDFRLQWDIAKLITGAGPDWVSPADIAARLAQTEDDESSFSWFLVRILGDLARPESVPMLIELLHQSPEEDMVCAIVTALSQIGAPAIAPVRQLLDQPQTRATAVQVLARIRHPDAVDALVYVIDAADSPTRALAIATLGDARHPQARPILTAALGDVAAEVRRAAVAGLGREDVRNEPAAVAKMGALLWDINLGVRRAAILALGRLRCDQAADLLYEALRSREMPELVRPDLIQALAFTETRAGLDHLATYARAIDALSRSDSALHGTIAASLGRIETPALIPVAVDLLKQLLARAAPDDSAVRQAIATSLGQLGAADGRPQANSDGGTVAGDLQVEIMDALVDLLCDADTVVRLHITAALRKLDAAAAHRRLVTAATAAPSTPSDLKQNAALALQDWEQVVYSDPPS